MKKKVLKGFTLIELIVVMAIFSILMAGALALLDPVSKINKSASDFEKTSAYVDNVQDYLQNSLKYAEDVWVYQGDYDNAALIAEVNKFKEKYYKGTVNTNDGSSSVYTKGKIRIMTILNNDMTKTEIDGSVYVDKDSDGNPLCKGQILLSEAEYKSDILDDDYNTSATPVSSISTPEIQLNPDFFNKEFSFEYVLGASKLKNTGNDTARLQNTIAGTPEYTARATMNHQNFAIGIVTYDNEEYAKLSSPQTGEYPFTCQYSVATIPLMNVISNKGDAKNYFVYEKKSEEVKDAYGNPVLDFEGNPVMKEYPNKSKVVEQPSSSSAWNLQLSSNPTGGC